MDKKSLTVLLVAFLLISMATAFAKLAIKNTVSIEFVFLQMLFASAALGFYTLVVKRSAFPLDRAHLKDYAILGVLASGLGQLLAMTGLAYSTVSNFALIHSLIPVTAMFFAAVWLGARFSKVFLAATIVMIAGVAIFITKLDPSSLSYKGIGDLLIFGKVVVVGFTNVYAQKAVSDKRTDAVTFGRFLFALPFLLLMVLLFGKFDFTGNLLYTALSGISFGVGTMLFYEGIRLTDASTGSNFNLTTPIYGMILGALFLGETYVPVQFLGAATIIVGGFFLVREKARENALRPSRS